MHITQLQADLFVAALQLRSTLMLLCGCRHRDAFISHASLGISVLETRRVPCNLVEQRIKERKQPGKQRYLVKCNQSS